VKPWILLRVSAGLYALFTLGHSFGALAAPSRGPEEVALFNAMRGLTINVQGFARTHWSFYRGYAQLEIVHLASLAVVCWIVSGMSRVDAREVRPLSAVLFAVSVGIAVLSWTFFFAAPGVISTLAALCLGMATLKS
jgi:hypothetical protein